MLARALKDNGHEVHFAIIPMEDGDAKSMAAFFDDKLTILPYRPTKGHARFFPRLKRYALRKLGSARAHVWGVDDWYDDGLSRAVADLYARERFDAAIAVYVFVSKALEALPDTRRPGDAVQRWPPAWRGATRAARGVRSRPHPPRALRDRA